MPRASIGTKIEVEIDSTWTEVTDLQSIPEIGGDPQEIDTTNLVQTEKTSIPGVKQTSALAIVAYFNNTLATDNYRVVRALEVAKSYNNWRITFPDGTKITMNARVTTKMGNVQVNGALMFTFNLYKKGDYVVTDPEGTEIIISPIGAQTVVVANDIDLTIITSVSGCTIGATSDDEANATVAVVGDVVTVTGVAAGSANITVTANKSGYNTGTQTFTVLVTSS